MTELLTHLQTRRSIPAINLAAPGPNDDEIRAMLTIAARVPDHGKIEPWRFIIYPRQAGERIGQRLADLWKAREPDADEKRLDLELIRFSRAPMVIGVLSTAGSHPKIPLWEQQLSAGAVCMNLLHAAAAHGFASQWITEWYAFDQQAGEFLGAGDGESFAGFIHLGTPTEPPVERQRPDVGTLTTTWNAG